MPWSWGMLEEVPPTSRETVAGEEQRFRWRQLIHAGSPGRWSPRRWSEETICACTSDWRVNNPLGARFAELHRPPPTREEYFTAQRGISFRSVVEGYEEWEDVLSILEERIIDTRLAAELAAAGPPTNTPLPVTDCRDCGRTAVGAACVECGRLPRHSSAGADGDSGFSCSNRCLCLRCVDCNDPRGDVCRTCGFHQEDVDELSCTSRCDCRSCGSCGGRYSAYQWMGMRCEFESSDGNNVCNSCCECSTCNSCDERIHNPDLMCLNCSRCRDCGCTCNSIDEIFSEVPPSRRGRDDDDDEPHEQVRFHVPSRGELQENKLARAVALEIEVAGLSLGGMNTVTRRRRIRDVRTTVERWGGRVVSDGSLPECGFEINTAPAGGDLLLRQVNEITDSLKAGRAWVNASCGLHVHVDARDFGWWDLRRLVILYERVEYGMFDIIAPSRLSGQYCVPCAQDYLHNVLTLDRLPLLQSKKGKKKRRASREATSGLKRGLYADMYNRTDMRELKELRKQKYNDVRYRALNLHSWNMRRSVEFRHHHGTVLKEKMLNWALLCTSLVDTAYKLPERALATWPRGVKGLVALAPTADVARWVEARAAHFAEARAKVGPGLLISSVVEMDALSDDRSASETVPTGLPGTPSHRPRRRRSNAR